jgi:hypothetical protein
MVSAAHDAYCRMRSEILHQETTESQTYSERSREVIIIDSWKGLMTISAIISGVPEISVREGIALHASLAIAERLGAPKKL